MGNGCEVYCEQAGFCEMFWVMGFCHGSHQRIHLQYSVPCGEGNNVAEAYRNPRFQAVPTTLWPTRAGSCSVVLKYQRVPGQGGPWFLQLVLTAKAHAHLWSDGLLHGADRLIICTLTLRPWLWFGFSWACVHRTVCFPIASFTFLF